MGRRYQNFVAPGDEDLSLPISSSCWHVGRLSTIPAEQWKILIEFANKKLSQDENFLEEVSYLDGDFSNFSIEKVAKFYCILEELISILRESEYINYEYLDEILYIHSNNEYIEMLETILAVVNESLKSSKFFNFYTD